MKQLIVAQSVFYAEFKVSVLVCENSANFPCVCWVLVNGMITGHLLGEVQFRFR